MNKTIRKWRIFRWSCPTEIVGIAWTFASGYEALHYVDKACEAVNLMDRLKLESDAGIIDGDKVQVRMRVWDKYSGCFVIIWEEPADE